MPASVLATDATIGLYSDSYGYSCSFSGNNSGPLTAYVFIKPGTVGVRAARFSAPIPSCFGATVVSESTPYGIVSIGDSQGGISVASGACEAAPFKVLEITYLANGNTTACCGFTIAPDPSTGLLEATDCAFNSIALNSTTSRFNADATCACGTTPPAYLPPEPPFNPFPAQQATSVPIDTQLRWWANDPQGLGLVADVYFGTDSNPPLIAGSLPSASTTIYSPGRLATTTTYFWRIVLRNSAQLETAGPLWHFTTAGNGPPSVTNRAPGNGATNVSLNPTLWWNAVDPEGDSVTYSVYFGTAPSPPLLVSGYNSDTYVPSMTLAFSTVYYWRIEARDANGHVGSSDVWSFITRPQSQPPTAPANPVPPDGTTGMSTTGFNLTWTASDPDGQPLKYDVYLGPKSASPGAPTVGLYVDVYGSTCNLAGNRKGLIDVWAVINPGALPLRAVSFLVSTPSCFDATYIGEEFFNQGTLGYTGNSQTGIDISSIGPPCITQVVAPLKITYMSNGATGCCAFPLQPHPYFGTVRARTCSGVETAITAVAGHLNADSTCACEGLYYQPRVAHDLAQPSYATGPLSLATTYQWRIVARDVEGFETSGPFWSFMTKVNHPPAVPSNPSPTNGATGQLQTATLSWQCSDPEADAITYDVYFGTATSPPLVASNVLTKSYDPGPLGLATTYRWKIVAHDAGGGTATGPVWSFSTTPPNRAPNAPIVVSPTNGATNQALNTIVKWNGTDPENDPLNFDVYFGTDASPPLAANHLGAKTYTPGPLQISTTYRWKVVARDVHGLETSGPVWSFTTTNTTSVPPLAPFNPIPPDGGTAGIRPTLRWQGSDPDGDPLKYVVWMYFGDTFPDSLGTTMDTFYPVQQDLLPGRTYYWFVTASDGHWTTDGPLWSFAVTTGGGGLPVAFQSFDAKQSGDDVVIKWRLESDEEMESFTLYRRPEGRTSSAIAEGGIAGATGFYIDNSVDAGRTYTYELSIHAASGNDFRSQAATVTVRSLDLTLYQNQPNPFNPETTIRYDLPPSPVYVRLLIADLSGRRVRALVDEVQSGGSRSVVWNGRDDSGNPVSSGVYFYFLEAGKQRLTKKLVLLK